MGEGRRRQGKAKNEDLGSLWDLGGVGGLFSFVLYLGVDGRRCVQMVDTALRAGC